jgi:hypothetical protein
MSNEPSGVQALGLGEAVGLTLNARAVQDEYAMNLLSDQERDDLLTTINNHIKNTAENGGSIAHIVYHIPRDIHIDRFCRGVTLFLKSHYPLYTSKVQEHDDFNAKRIRSVLIRMDWSNDVPPRE